MNTLPKEQREILYGCFRDGLSLRTASVRAKTDKNTALRYKRIFDEDGGIPKNMCDFCRVREIHEDSEFHRKNPRFKRAYCSQYCYGMANTSKKLNQICKKCSIRRGDIPFPSSRRINWSRGYCGKCYGVLRLHYFDQDLSDVYLANQKLKREIKNVHQKHV